MKLFSKHLIALMGFMTVIAVTPTTALAGGSVHIDVPGFSIGVHDDHRYRKRHHRKHHRKHYRKRYYDNYYYDDYRPRKYYKRKYRYNNRNYYNDRRYRDNYYYRDRRVEVCPIDGYSRYYDRGRDCYEHKGHYHCS